MKIGILSDSHDNVSALKKAVGLFNDAEVDLVLHVGVFGNNDGDKLNLNKALDSKVFLSPHILEVESLKILLMHEPYLLSSIEKSGDFDIIIYGHTHEVDIRKERSLIINPGECGGWLNGDRTVAILDTYEMKVNILRV